MQLSKLVSGSLLQEGGYNGLIFLGKLTYFWQFVLITNGVTLVSSLMLNNDIIFVCSLTLWEMAEFWEMTGDQNKEASVQLWYDFTPIYLGMTYNPKGPNWIYCDYVSMHYDDFNIFHNFVIVLN